MPRFIVLKKGGIYFSENTAKYILINDYLHLCTENIYYLDNSCDIPFTIKWNSLMSTSNLSFLDNERMY